MQISFANSQGIHVREVKGIEILKEKLPPDWYAFANLEIINPGKMGRQIDVAIVLDDRIILADIKDWYGKITSDGDTWYQNDRRMEGSPVKKIAENVRTVASLLRTHLKKHLKTPGEPPIPLIMSCVVLTGRCNIDGIDDSERSRVFYVDDFCRAVTDRRQRYERFGDPGWIDKANPFVARDSVWRQRLSSFFTGRNGNFRAQEKTYAGHRVVSDVVYAHPEGAYAEHDCVEINTDRSTGLLRLWDFSKAPVKFASEEYRNDVAGREQSVLAYLLDRNPEMERIALRPKTADTERGIRYWEIFERRKQLRRLADFVGNGLAELSRMERLDLLRTLLAHAADLHRMGAAHLDLGGHSVWLEAPATVRLSHFLSAHYGENRSLADDRYTFLGQRITLPEDILGGRTDHFRRDVFLLGRIAHIILFGTEPQGGGGNPPEWNAGVDVTNTFSDIHDWLAMSLDTDPEGRFKDASVMLEAFNLALRREPDTTAIVERLQRYKRWKSILQVLQAFPLSGDPIKDDDRILVYASDTSAGRRLVKLWKSSNWQSEATDATRLLEFFERAELLSLQESDSLAAIREFGYLGDHLAVVADYVGDQGLDELMEGGGYDRESAMRFLLALVDAVDGLHDLNIGHGDLSPRNVRIRVDEQGLHPVLIDVLEFGPPRHNPAYSPAFACGLLERDRHAVLKMAEEVLAQLGLPVAEDARIQAAVNVCRENHPRLSTLRPFRDAVEKALSPEPEEDAAPEILIQLVGLNEPTQMLADEGLYHICVQNDGPARKKVSVVGAGSELLIFLDDTGKPRRANFRTVDQAKVSNASRWALVTMHWRIKLEPADFWDFTDFDAILSLPQVADTLALEGAGIEDDEGGPTAEVVKPGEITEDLGIDDSVPQPVDSEDIDVPALWRKLIDVETEQYTEAVADSDSHFSRQDKRHFLAYSLSRGALDFNRDDVIEVKMAHPKRDGWITIGRLDVDLTNGKHLAVDASFSRSFQNGPICREGTVLRFDSLFEMDSRNRRDRATTRILGGKSTISHLIDYFDLNAEPEVRKNAALPDEDWLKAFYGLNASQATSFRHLWGNGPVGLLQGPPGTGKTTFIAAFVHYALTEGRLRNVLLASQSHEAVNTAAEDILDLFRRHGGMPSLVRVGQEGAVSDRLMPFHTAHVEALYRERFRARLKENYLLAGRRLSLPQDFVEAFFQAAVTLRPVLRQIHNLRTAVAEHQVSQEEQEMRSSSLLQTVAAITENLNLPECCFAPGGDGDGWFDDVVTALAGTHGIGNRENVRRLSKVMRLSDDWLGHVGGRRRSFEEFLVNTRQIVCGTCVGLGRASLGLSDAVFDLVIVDEAARCTPGELAVPLQSAKRVLLVGDHLQLEPFHDPLVVESTAKALGISQDAVRASDFERAFRSSYGRANGQALRIQYRMLEPIGHLVSKVFYEPGVKLEHGRATPKLPAEINPGSLDKPIFWLDTSPMGAAAFQSKAGGRNKSLVNTVEADTIVKLLTEMDDDQAFQQWMADNVESGAKPVGVICGYAGQKELLLRKVAAAGLSPGFRERIKIDTVDSYQGKQNLIVILSLVRNNNDGTDHTIRQGFMSRVNRINVALSRAMDRLVIVGSAKHWPLDGPMAAVAATVRELEQEKLARVTPLGASEGGEE